MRPESWRVSLQRTKMTQGCLCCSVSVRRRMFAHVL